MSVRRTNVWKGSLLMALAAVMVASLLPPLRNAIGIDQPDAKRFDQTRRMFGAALNGNAATAIEPDAAKLGLTIADGPHGWQGIMISEPDGACVGKGAYLLRQSDGAFPIAITAPHRGADRHTGNIAANLFLESKAAAAAWNSAPRNPQRDCPNAVDLARQPSHTFTAFSLGFADAHPEGLIVQLHGFERMKRGPGVAREADMILSNGTREPSARLLDLADCLSVEFAPLPLVIFPNETEELGALANAQAGALHSMGFGGFVHLELSSELRARLVKDERLRGRLLYCLGEVAR